MYASPAEVAAVVLLAAAVYLNFARLARIATRVALCVLKLLVSFTCALTLFAAYKIQSTGASSKLFRFWNPASPASHGSEL
jgi:hypothetical protein